MGRSLKKLLQYIQRWQIFSSVRKVDPVLLLLCLVTTAFGCLIISSATNYMDTIRYVLLQIVAAGLGVFLYAVVSSIDAEFFSEHRLWLIVFNCFLLLLLVPFGTDNGTGNKSWLDFVFLPFYIQPAEFCKISFILIMASVMAANQNKISHITSIGQMAFQIGLLVVLNLLVSRDMGVSLIFVFIFIGMAWTGGVNPLWFAAGGGLVVAVWPMIWNHVFSGYQRLRFEVLYNPDIDPAGIGVRWHSIQSLKSLTGGGMIGQGLFSGNRTQQGALTAQHTDYIFSAIGEELGFLGCALAIILLILIILRCIWVGNRSPDYLRKQICFGCAAALIFQVISNVGMCIGITPVIGLTLPFISYGGSSIASLYLMMGLVSGVYARPTATSHERYIRPPYYAQHY